MTPLEFVAIMTGRAWAREEAEKDRIVLAWYTAGFSRTARLPDLDLLLCGGELPEQSPLDMLEVLMILRDGGAEISIVEVEAPPWRLQ